MSGNANKSNFSFSEALGKNVSVIKVVCQLRKLKREAEIKNWIFF